MEPSITTLAIAVCLSLAVGAAAAWFLHRLGEGRRRQEYEAYNKELVRAANVARDRVREEKDDTEARLELLRAEHSRCGESLGGMRRRLERVRDVGSEADAQVAELQTRLAEIERALSESESGRARLALELKAALDAAELAERSNDQARKSITALEVALEQRKAEVRRLHDESQPDGRDEPDRGSALEQVHKAQIAKLEGELDELRGLLNARAPDWLMAEPEGPKDELQKIRGLGRVIEQRLNALGVFHFSQLSNMTAEDAEWLASRIHVHPSRIRRERWVTQARSFDSRRRTGA